MGKEVRTLTAHPRREHPFASTEALIGAARGAGVSRIVHVSIAHTASRLAYFRGKGIVEEAIRFRLSQNMPRP